MIVTETYELDGKGFVRTHSDAGRYVVRDGISYEEACDPAGTGRTYTEGEIIPDAEDMADKAAAYDILTGVSE